MEAVGIVLISLVAVVVSGLLARVTRLPAPLVQIGLGAAIHTSGLSSVVLDPELFFLLFLPPLLFLDGWRIPNDALARDAPAILRLALGLVLFTVLGMGLFIHWLVPAMPLAVSFALAAVIAPTDPIAVSEIAERNPMPSRLLHVLQGESLLNDASGLVCMRLAVAAALTGSFSVTAAVGSILWLAAAGIGIGASVAWLVAKATVWTTQRFGDDGGAQILVTLLLPFGVYLLAEQVHGSGILAAVAAGVMMSVTDVWPWSATTRLRRTAVWDSVQLAATGSVFVLLGQQLPALVSAAPASAQDTVHPSVGGLLGLVLVIVAALLALRFAWVWASIELGLLGARLRGEKPALTSARLVAVMSLAGVRGAITLAGVMTLPLVMGDGTPFPARDLAILLAAGVIVVSLVLAAAVLPALLRGLELAPEPSLRAAHDRARRAAAEAAIAAIEAARHTLPEGRADAQHYATAAAWIVELYRQRIDRYGGAGLRAPAARGKVDAIERQLRLLGLQAERAEFTRLRAGDEIDDTALRHFVHELDHQEARFGAAGHAPT